MSDIGYQNSAQSDLFIDYSSLEHYVDTLSTAIKTPHPDFEQIDATHAGEYQQLNKNILQIENEYYASIRPKRNAQSGERPTKALQSRGVEYIELRCLDLDPFLSIGIDEEQALFLDTLILLIGAKPCVPW